MRNQNLPRAGFCLQIFYRSGQYPMVMRTPRQARCGIIDLESSPLSHQWSPLRS